MIPRKPEKFEEIREQSKWTIIAAATKVFSEFGYQATIEKIAKTANISKGLIYNYFKSKDELLEAIFIEGFTFFDEIMQLNGQAEKPLQKLDCILSSFVHSLSKNLTFWRLYQNIISDPIISKKLTKFNEYFETVFYPLLFSIFTELYDSKMSEMQIQIEVLIFAAIMDGLAFDYVIIGGEYPLDMIKDTIIQKYKNSSQ